jgi:hypothetical protein
MVQLVGQTENVCRQSLSSTVQMEHPYLIVDFGGGDA